MEAFKKVLPAVVFFLAVGVFAVDCTSWDSGAGMVYTLSVVQDVWLECCSNHDHQSYLIVGVHHYYPKKRFLVQFEDLPSQCSHVEWAKMYVYYVYAHKASWMSVQQAPFISRTLQLHQVKKQWNETQATNIYRTRGTPWSRSYLALDGTDASPHALSSVTVFTGRPQGLVEVDVTEAVRNWKDGDPNYGILVWATNEEDQGRDIRFYSKSYSDSSKHAFVRVLCN